ncbi:unnamed protein product, partial [Polarella glacialis]
ALRIGKTAIPMGPSPTRVPQKQMHRSLASIPSPMKTWTRRAAGRLTDTESAS